MSKHKAAAQVVARSSSSSESSSGDSDDDISSVAVSQLRRRQNNSDDDTNERRKGKSKSNRSNSGKKGRSRGADYDSDDVALVPRESRPIGSIPAAPPMVQPKASKRRRQRSETVPDDSELEHPEQDEREGDPPPAKRRGSSKGSEEKFGIYEAQKGLLIGPSIAFSIELAGPSFYQTHADQIRQKAVEAAIDSNPFAFPGGRRKFQEERRAHQGAWLRFMSKIKGSCGSHSSVSNMIVKLFELLRVLLLAFPFMLILGCFVSRHS